MAFVNVPKGSRAFKKTLKASNLIVDNTVISASTFTEVGALKVGAKTVMGFGFAADGSFLIGRLYALIRTAAPATINGNVRLVHTDANRTKKAVVWEGRTEDLANGLTDPRLRVALEAAVPGVGEDSYLVLEMQADAASTVSLAQSTLLIDSWQVFL